MLGTLALLVFYQCCFYVVYYSLHFVEVSDYKKIKIKINKNTVCVDFNTWLQYVITSLTLLIKSKFKLQIIHCHSLERKINISYSTLMTSFDKKTDVAAL